MNQYYHSLSTSEGRVWKIHVFFDEELINLTVFENDTAWKAELSKGGLSEQPSYDSDYEKNLQKLFSLPENGKFEFDNGCFRISLLLENHIWMVFFSCKLTQVNFTQNVYSLLDEFYNSNKKNCKELDELRNQYAATESAYKTLEKKMNEFLDRRKSEEISLHNKFIAILNEKKRQIQHLNDLLTAFRRGRPTINPAVEAKGRKKAPTRSSKKSTLKKPPVPSSGSEETGSDDENNYNTDEESARVDKVNNYVSGEGRTTSPIPSTSGTQIQRADSFLDQPSQAFKFPRRNRNENAIKEYEVIPNKCTQEDNDSITEEDALDIDPKEQDYSNYNTQDLLNEL